MTTAIATREQTALDPAIVQQVLLSGDLSRLTPEQRISYYQRVCESVGLNPLTQPFAYLRLNGKEVLYALKSATEQLRFIHNISIDPKAFTREVIEGIYVVTAPASMPNGRTDVSTGAVPVETLKGEARANAMMKAETKAKRRVTLSICGLGMLDETEVESIKGAEPVVAVTAVVNGQPVNAITGEVMKDDGLLRVVSCTRQPTTSNRGCWLLTLSDGRECYSFKEQEATIAEKFAQEQTAVVVDTKESKRGLDLVSLKAFAASREAHEGEAAPEPPVAITADQIPF